MAIRKVYLLDEALVAKIEDYRFRCRIGTESAAVRRLLEIALTSMGENSAQIVAGRDVDARRANGIGTDPAAPDVC